MTLHIMWSAISVHTPAVSLVLSFFFFFLSSFFFFLIKKTKDIACVMLVHMHGLVGVNVCV